MEILGRAIEVTATVQTLPSLYSGFAGVAWTVEHLRNRLFEEPEGEDAGEEVAAAITKHISVSPWRGDYDLLNGLVGYGIYALERRPRSYGQECLEQVVARLAEIAERGPGGATWKTGPGLLAPRNLEIFPQGYYDLGLADRVPGVVGLLALAQAAGVECHDLLDRAVAWLLSHKLPDGYDSVLRLYRGVRRRAQAVAPCLVLRRSGNRRHPDVGGSRHGRRTLATGTGSGDRTQGRPAGHGRFWSRRRWPLPRLCGGPPLQSHLPGVRRSALPRCGRDLVRPYPDLFPEGRGFWRL